MKKIQPEEIAKEKEVLKRQLETKQKEADQELERKRDEVVKLLAAGKRDVAIDIAWKNGFLSCVPEESLKGRAEVIMSQNSYHVRSSEYALAQVIYEILGDKKKADRAEQRYDSARESEYLKDCVDAATR